MIVHTFTLNPPPTAKQQLSIVVVLTITVLSLVKQTLASFNTHSTALKKSEWGKYMTLCTPLRDYVKIKTTLKRRQPQSANISKRKN